MSLVLVLLGTLLSLLTPWPLKIVVDSVLQQQPLPPSLASAVALFGAGRYTLLIVAVVAGFVITLVSNALTVDADYVNTKIHENMVLDFRSDLFQHAQRLSLAFHDQAPAGEADLRHQLPGRRGRRTADERCRRSLKRCSRWSACSGSRFTSTRTLALLSLTVVPLLYYSVWLLRDPHPGAAAAGQGHGGRVAVDHPRGDVDAARHRGVRPRGSRVRPLPRARASRPSTRASIVTVRQTLFSLAVNTTTALGTALVLGFGAYHVLQGRLTVGQLLVVMAYIAMVYKPLEAISTTVGSLQDKFDQPARWRSTCSTRSRRSRTRLARAICRRAPGGIVLREVSLQLHGPDRHAEGHLVRGAAGPGRRDRRADRRRQDDAGQPDPALLRRRRSGRILHRRHRHPGPDAAVAARSRSASCCRSRCCSPARSPTTSATAGSTRRMEEIIEAAKAANAHDFIMRLPQRIRDGPRRARRAALRRRAPAHLRRARVPEGRADPDPRRADVVDRLEDRGASSSTRSTG